MDAAFIEECLDDELWAQRERIAIDAIHTEALDALRYTLHSETTPNADTLAKLTHVERRIAALEGYVADTKTYLWWLPVPPKRVRQMLGLAW